MGRCVTEQDLGRSRFDWCRSKMHALFSLQEKSMKAHILKLSKFSMTLIVKIKTLQRESREVKTL